MFDFSIVTQWVHSLLTSFMPDVYKRQISFHIDGITEGETLFTVIGGPEAPVINAGMPGTEGIQGGFEGGSIVTIKGTYHMFPTERAGVKGRCV